MFASLDDSAFVVWVIVRLRISQESRERCSSLVPSEQSRAVGEPSGPPDAVAAQGGHPAESSAREERGSKSGCGLPKLRVELSGFLGH